VAEPFVRFTVTDDLRRSRLTVFFRLLLAIPHFFWWSLWTFVAAFAVVVNWFATLITGRSPNGFHGLLTVYIRYSTHLLSYVYLAANPYPGFFGDRDYPVDIQFGAPEPQRRVVTAFRLFLTIPALLLSATLTGGAFLTYGGGILLMVAFLAWFACLIRGRMPSGFRDLQVYGLRYLAEFLAYLFVLTERYPIVDPSATPASGREHSVWLTLDDDLRRSRLTVFFRLLLSLPHFVWLTLWSLAIVPAAFVTWIAALIAGRPPRVLHRFLSAFLRYSTHVYAYVALTANPFPGFTGGSYPVGPVFPPAERQPRLVTAFRFFLALPALLVNGAVGALIIVAALLGWFASLALGRMPTSLRNAQAYALRYSAQVSAYLFLVTDRYPYSGPIRVPPQT
jgi:hypothetical protein